MKFCWKRQSMFSIVWLKSTMILTKMIKSNRVIFESYYTMIKSARFRFDSDYAINKMQLKVFSRFLDIYACPLWIMYNLSFFFFSQVFDNQGSFLTFINTSGDPLYGPQGISITCDGHVVVADSGNHCLKIYRYLQWNLASLWWPQLFFDATTRVILLPIQSTRGIMLLLLFDPTTRVILLPSKPAGRLFRCCCYYYSLFNFTKYVVIWIWILSMFATPLWFCFVHTAIENSMLSKLCTVLVT